MGFTLHSRRGFYARARRSRRTRERIDPPDDGWTANRFKLDFTYDGQSRMRIKRDYTWSAGAWANAGETRYLYDGMLIVQERSSANAPIVTYTRGRDLSGSLSGAGGIGGLLARSSGYSSGSWSTHDFYHADGNPDLRYGTSTSTTSASVGVSITAMVNASGTLRAYYEFSSIGGFSDKWTSSCRESYCLVECTSGRSGAIR